MTEKELRARIEAAVGDVDLADTDIPAIDLYLDIINLFLRLLDVIDKIKN